LEAVFAWKAVKADFREHLAADMDCREWIVTLGQFGYLARGLVFVLVGSFLMLAARGDSTLERPRVLSALCEYYNSKSTVRSCWA
jgi:hypothetical protein